MKRHNRPDVPTIARDREQPRFRRCKAGAHQYMGEPLACAKCGAAYRRDREHYP